MIDKVDRKHKGIRKDYDDLCELVHPNPASLYANIEPLNQEGKTLKIRVSTKSTRINEKEAVKYIELLIARTDWLFEELVNLYTVFSKIVSEEPKPT